METIDHAKEAQVWQRVRGQQLPEDPREGLQELIAREWEVASICLQLSRRFTGRQSAQLRQLYEKEQSHGACLKGIYTLISGQRPYVRSVSAAGGLPEAELRRCYGKQMQNLAEYERRSNHPEYGHVFQNLAHQERTHCHLLLEILGSMK